MRQKAFFNWSSGKDSALALYQAMHDGHFDVVTLFTTLAARGGAIPMHEVGLPLLERQAAHMGLPLITCPLGATEAENHAAMQDAMGVFLRQGIQTALFGDIFLSDIRHMREAKLAKTGIRAAFPLWGMDSRTVLTSFFALGFRAIITCVDGAVLDRRFVGQELTPDLLRSLPAHADPCGERGEYHSFVFDGPLFRTPVPFHMGTLQCHTYPGATPDAPPHPFWYLPLS